ncbi:MAG: selenide, water dikinase SelD, partial [Candidatus Binatia bacterium]
SDVYAMGGVPKTALNVVCFPQDELDSDVLQDILHGAFDKATEAGVVIVGGHTVDDPEIKFGMAVTGVIDPRRVVRNVGAQSGDALVLTKALGTGILTTALKRRRLSETAYAAAVASMSMLNRSAAEAMLRFEVHAATDVTGFGLLGHAYEMAYGDGVTLRFESAALPLLPEVEEQIRAGQLTGGCKRNRKYLDDKISIDRAVSRELCEVAFDPQTSGGLLIAVPGADADRLVADLRSAGLAVAARIGTVVARTASAVELV